MSRILKQLGMVTAAIALLMAIPALASADNGDKGEGTCVARWKSWELGWNDGDMSLLQAVNYANGFKSSQWCQKRVLIDVKGDTLQMRSPLVIIGNGSEFVLEGAGGDNRQGEVVLDARNLAGVTDADRCAVKIAGNGITLNRIKITNVPADWTAVCANSANARIGDMTISSEGSGVVFKDTIIGGQVGGMAPLPMLDANLDLQFEEDGSLMTEDKFTAPSIEVTSGSGFAVNMGDSISELSGNRIIPMDVEGKVTDASGTILPVADEKTIVIKAPKVDQLINSSADVYACLKEVKPVERDGKQMVRVTGLVKDAAGSRSKDIVRLQIYNAKGFVGYVGEYNTTAMAGMNRTNLSEGESTGKTAWFKFFVDKDADSSAIIVVPEDAIHNIGRPSEVINISGSDQAGKCFNDQIGDGECVGDECNKEPGSYKQVLSIGQCKTKRGIDSEEQHGALGDLPGYDTDLDGIDDDIEDKDFDCECDDNETCWYRADSDNDGVPDGSGGEKLCGKLACGAAGNDITIVNAKNPDSDGDGASDGVEDRNHGVNFKKARSVLYAYQKASVNPVMVGGAVQTCELGASGAVAGVAYDWYRNTYQSGILMKAVKSGYETLQDVEAAQEGTGTVTKVEMMVCRLESLAWPQNFNGAYDKINNESDAYASGDTDGDVVGDATDRCPGIEDNNTALDSNGCPNGISAPCLEYQQFFTTNPEYVLSADGAPKGLKTCDEAKADDSIKRMPGACGKEGDGSEYALFTIRDADGRPDFVRMAQVTGDSDEDGIPDPVENSEPMACSGGKAIDALTKLAYNSANTDDEGLMDGVGMNGDGQSDECPSNLSTSCSEAEKRRVYQYQPILSCFLDRDGDGLRDCQEDINMDGTFDEKANPGVAITAELMLTIESDPLDKDSDGDGLSDKQERTVPVNELGYFTNPVNADTDSDGLADKEEDNDNGGIGDGVFTLGEISNQGCSMVPNLDTDPTLADTDGDGIDDKVEYDPNGANQNFGLDEFMAHITDDATLRAGIDVISNPRSKDSDGDGLSDLQEYGTDGLVGFYDANPCMKDSDKDGIVDQDEFVGCALNASPTCKGENGKMKDKQGESDTSNGIDRDSDGLSDECEAQLGSDPANNDTDGDGLLDGEEESGDCVYTPGKLRPDSEFKYETNALDQDTDDDGLSDYQEMGVGKYGTDPTIDDTDGDCIPDGLEDANLNGKWDAGETNAISADTDEDGLPDGKLRGIGEDLNCNGVRDTDVGGSWTETDPTNPDSDFDGQSDFTEMNAGGWNLANLPGAVNGAGEGCSLGGGSAAPTSMIYLLGMLLMATKAVGRRMRRK